MTKKIQRVVKSQISKPRVINKIIKQGIGRKPGSGMEGGDGYSDTADHELQYPESYVDTEKTGNQSSKINNPLTSIRKIKGKTFIR